MSNTRLKRRDFIRLTTFLGGAMGMGSGEAADGAPHAKRTDCPSSDACSEPLIGAFDGVYENEHSERVAFPLGGIGAGMICLDGVGTLSHFSLRNRPGARNEPGVFSAISILGSKKIARVIEGPVPAWKMVPAFRSGGDVGDAERMTPASLGLPRFRRAKFSSRFPFASVTLHDDDVPLAVKLTGWSPFEPADADSSSLPVAGLEYEFTNISAEPIDAVFSFNAMNFLAAPSQWWKSSSQEASSKDRIRGIKGGFVLQGAGAEAKTWDECSFAAWVDDPNVRVNHAWFRGIWADTLTMAWNEIERGAHVERAELKDGDSAPGASLSMPISLAPGASKTITLCFAWYTAKSNVRCSGGGRIFKLINDGNQPGKETYRPWYVGKFASIDDVAEHWRNRYHDLKMKSARFSNCFYDSTLPAEIIEAVSANLTILKSPTVLRQTDGRLWGWEGSGDSEGLCPGSCTHVWNYAQSIPHLFPGLERTLRETEFGPSLNAEGRQVFRTAIPIRFEDQDFESVPAADGQLGGILKVYRDWRISGDTEWLRRLWPKVRLSLDYCIRTWDSRHQGWLEGFQHNTYDMPLYGVNGMCSSIYLSALQAAIHMARALHDDALLYETLLARGKSRLETELFNGEYFVQKLSSDDVTPHNPFEEYLWIKSPEMVALERAQGPRYQYGNGCLSDGVIGEWFSFVAGLDGVLDNDKVLRHLRAVHRYNFKENLAGHVNPMRSFFAGGEDGGLLLCTWPKNDKPSIPFPYSSEVWTGIEYQVASHLISLGCVQEGLEIVRACRKRYNGRVRNPFNEVELGHWYARAMASYALLQAFSGARYDAVEKVLYLKPAIQGDFRCFLSTATGYGTVGVRNGVPFCEVAAGDIRYTEIKYTPAA